MSLIVVAACSRPLPPAVALPVDADPTAGATGRPIRTRADALAFVLDGDPLCRSPKLPPASILARTPGTEALRATIADFEAAEGPGRDLLSGLKLITSKRPGTETTAIARGYRLGLADRLIGTWQDTTTAPELADVAPLLSELRKDEAPTGRVRHPLSFLARDMSFGLAVRRHGDRWVLVSWLDGPGIPLEPVAEALEGPSYDDLRDSRLGRLVRARAADKAGDASLGLSDLQQATLWSLQRASADRPTEQGDWGDVRKQASETLGVTDPIGFLLDRAADRLIDAAGDDRATGGALVALSARRWIGGCDWAPCQGIDRVEVLGRARAWDPSLEGQARAWRVIALKDAIDTMEVGHDTVLFDRALVDLVDALMGTGGSPVPASLMSRKSADAEVWGLLGASIGAPAAATWDDLRVAVGSHLAVEARLALEVADDASRPWLERILRRAVP